MRAAAVAVRTERQRAVLEQPAPRVVAAAAVRVAAMNRLAQMVLITPVAAVAAAAEILLRVAQAAAAS